MAKMTPLDLERAVSTDPAGKWESCIYCENPGAHYLSFPQYLPLWVFFQMLILRIYPFPFNVKISSHRYNPAQRNLCLWILIRNPQRHFSSSGGFQAGGGLSLTHVNEGAFRFLLRSCGGFAGLRAVGGRARSDKSLPSPAASLGMGNSWGLGRYEMSWGRLWGSGFPQSLAKSFWSQDSCSPWGFRPPWKSEERSAACLSNFV